MYRPMPLARPFLRPWRTRPGAAIALLALLGACAGDSATGVPTGTPNEALKGSGIPVPAAAGANVLAGASLYVDASSNARRTADSWRSTRPVDAAQLDK